MASLRRPRPKERAPLPAATTGVTGFGTVEVNAIPPENIAKPVLNESSTRLPYGTSWRFVLPPGIAGLTNSSKEIYLSRKGYCN